MLLRRTIEWCVLHSYLRFQTRGKRDRWASFFVPQGVACKEYFMPGPALNFSLRKSLIDMTSPPDILVHKLVTPDNVEKLFDM
jgi:hypothetical protein